MILIYRRSIIMLGSFGSDKELDDHPSSSPPQYYHHHHHHPPLHARQLLITCANLISVPDPSAARRILNILSSNSSPYGDSTERLVHQFTRALSLRLSLAPSVVHDRALLQSSYLSLNLITPFVHFSHLTANQAILEAIEGRDAIHIIDIDIMHGVQWPPLMQAVAERRPPPTLRITGGGEDLSILRRTGDRLAMFAHSLGLRFQFHPMILLPNDHDSISRVVVQPDEALAVNCIHCLHRFLGDRDRLCLLLRRIKSMHPAVVALAEREADHNHACFRRRVAEAVEHYAAVFDSLEATVPPGSGERMEVEQVWFGREIVDIVSRAEGEGRHERFGSWDSMFGRSGLGRVGLSGFAWSQAKLLLRLHYPSEGYELRILNGSFFLGWQNQPLFSVSSWH